MALDLKKPEGQEIIYQLVKKSEVFASNYREETLERLNLGYKTLRQLNPGLIYAQASGFGSKGPDGNRAAFDLTAQGRSGIMSIITEKGRPPMDAGIGIADQMGGIMLSYGVITALLDKMFAEKNRDEWLELFDKNGLISGPIYDYQDLIRDRQVWENCYLTEGEHPVCGSLKVPGFPVQFETTPAKIKFGAPEHGGNTTEILQELLGYGPDSLEKLKEQGVIKR